MAANDPHSPFRLGKRRIDTGVPGRPLGARQSSGAVTGTVTAGVSLPVEPFSRSRDRHRPRCSARKEGLSRARPRGSSPRAEAT